MKASVVKVAHRTLGSVSVKIDAEDKKLFTDKVVRVEMFSGTQSPKVRVGEDRTFAARMILEAHNMLDIGKNVFFKNGDSFDLQKKNLYQIA